MSPQRLAALLQRQRFPRVSGDEPRLILVMTTKIVFSPRERG